MKKIFLTLSLLVGVAMSTFAQTKDAAKLSLGIDAGLVVGDASTIASMAIGASVKYDIPVFTKSFFTLSAGYSYLPYNNDYKIDLAALTPTQSAGESYVPLKAGFKYQFCSMFYGEAQVGAAISTQGNGTGFAYAPGLGFKFGTGVDLGLRYEAWSQTTTLSQVALRLGYSF